MCITISLLIHGLMPYPFRSFQLGVKNPMTGVKICVVFRFVFIFVSHPVQVYILFVQRERADFLISV